MRPQTLTSAWLGPARAASLGAVLVGLYILCAFAVLAVGYDAAVRDGRDRLAQNARTIAHAYAELSADAAGTVPADRRFRQAARFLAPASLHAALLDRDGKVMASLRDLPAGLVSSQGRFGTSAREFLIERHAVPVSGLSVALAQTRAAALAPWKRLLPFWLASFAVLGAGIALLVSAFTIERRRAESAEAASLKSAAQLDMAVAGAGCGIWRWELTPGRIDWSASMMDMLGYEPRPAALPRHEFGELVHPEDRGVVAGLEAAADGPYDVTLRLRHQDGGWIWVKARGEIAQATDGGGRVLTGIAVDVTEQKEAEAEASRKDALLRDAVETIAEGFVLWDRDSRLVLYNERFCAFHGVAANALEPGMSKTDVQAMARWPGEPIAQHTANALMAGHERSAGNVLRAGPRWLQVDSRRLKDGSVVSVETDISPLKSRHEELMDKQAELTRTVSDLQISRAALNAKAAELAQLAEKCAAATARAEEANRSKSQFLAHMSHELRTPLNAIIGFSEVMQEQLFGELGHEKYREYARDIKESGELLLDIISDILDMSKIEAGRVPQNPETFDVVQVARESLRLVEARARERGIALDMDTGGAVPAYADRRAVKQILLNLLSNAIKFTPSGGTVTLAIEPEADKLTVRVRDTGIGIAAADIPRLGRPFVRLPQPDASSVSGTGLGLALARSLVELNGGRLDISSQEGAGTTVSFTLPPAESETPQEPLPSAS